MRCRSLVIVWAAVLQRRKSLKIKCLLLMVGFLLHSEFGVSGQTMSAEIDLLREQLGVSASVPITMANSPDLPKDESLKVYIAAGFDMEVRKRTAERIEEWNKKDAVKYGALKLVTEIDQADVILVNYSDREHPITKVGGTAGQVGTAIFIPGNSYIVVPKGQGYEVLWRYQGKSHEFGKDIPGQTMRDHSFEMLKHRSRME
jgi:hypothetical protein